MAQSPAADGPWGTYQDLLPNSTLTVVLPLLKSGRFLPTFQDQQISGNTITLTSNDVIGYITFNYTVRESRGPVRLKMVVARETKDGQTVRLRQPPPLPFHLPQKAAYIRLFFLVRASKSDHNMAIIASKSLPALEALTARLNNDPAFCVTNTEISCLWIPSGVAVRAE